MKRASLIMFVLVSLLLMAAIAGPAMAQAEFACTDGSNVTITNGVEFTILQIRPGNYRVSVLGVDGFDPVLAVVDPATRSNLCSDDASGASRYGAVLPSTGTVSPSSMNAQVDFRNTSSGFMDISLAVGGFGGSTGEFILVIEEMQVTTTDNLGDPFQIVVSQNVIDSGVGVHAYAIHVAPALDPLLMVVDDNGDIVQLSSGPLYCDDASSASLCWRANASDAAVSLEGFGLTDGSGSVVADPFDAYLYLPVSVLSADAPIVTFVVSSYSDANRRQSTGEYVFAIHTGIGAAGGSGINTGTASGNIWNIAYGDSGSTQIDTDGGDTFVFDGRAGDIVTIAVNSTDFDPLIVVTDINGRELARDDDSGPGLNALITNLRIPANGQYLIVVTSFNGDVSVGATYDISLTGA